MIIIQKQVYPEYNIDLIEIDHNLIIVRHLRHGLLHLPDPILVALLAQLHVVVRSELIAAIYDALGVPHDGPKLMEQEEPIELSADQCIVSVRGLIDQFPQERVWLCLGSMAEITLPLWRGPISEARDALAPGEGDQTEKTQSVVWSD